MRAHRPSPISVLAAALAAIALSTGCNCGDNLDDGLTADADVDAPVIDAAVDAPTCDSPDPQAIGGACSETSQCVLPNDAGASAFCLNDALRESWPQEGFCTAFCTDDSQCGEGSTCAMLPDPGTGGSFGACMPDCCDAVGVGQACETGRICSNELFGDPIMTEACVPGTVGAADGDPCTTFAECDRNSICRSDVFQFPNGQCSTIQCSSDDDCAPNGDGRCVDLPDAVAPVCVDACDTDADCREAEGYRCIDAGGSVGKYCQHPAPGDACTVDADCGLASEDWVCRTGGLYPNGYCTIEACDPANNNTCPIFSFCVSLASEADNFCADECSTPGGNECGTGYDCVTITIGGTGDRNVCIPAGETTDLP